MYRIEKGGKLIKKIVYILFGITIIISIFEVGFYLGINFLQRDADKINIADVQPTIIPTITLTTPSSPIPTSISEFRSNSGISITSIPSINWDFLPSLIGVLRVTDKDFLKKASISYVFQGRIIELLKNTNFVRNGKQYNNYYSLKLENPKTGVAAYIDSSPQDELKEINFWSKLNSPNKLLPITIDDLRVGDLVEVEKAGDLIKGKIIERNLTLLER